MNCLPRSSKLANVSKEEAAGDNKTKLSTPVLRDEFLAATNALQVASSRLSVSVVGTKSDNSD